LQFAWSDELAQLLIDEGDATFHQVGAWMTSPIGHRLPENDDPLAFARRLFAAEVAGRDERRAS